MDKSTIKHDKNKSSGTRIIQEKRSNGVVHRLPQRGESPFHKEFGLWICRAGSGGRSGSTIQETALRYFEFYCISQLLDGTGYYRDSENAVTTFKPGKGVLVTPGSLHRFGGYHDTYHENTICFTGRLPDLFRGIGMLPSEVIKMDDPKRLQQIIEKSMDPGLVSQTQANIELVAYLEDLFRMNVQKTTTGDLLDELTANVQDKMNRWWTVKEMAEFCNMSEVRFRTLFRKRYGMAPKNYLDSLKVNAAIELLTDLNLHINEIAADLGYIDPFHFSRRFKQLTGYSPRDYRQHVLVK